MNMSIVLQPSELLGWSELDTDLLQPAFTIQFHLMRTPKLSLKRFIWSVRGLTYETRHYLRITFQYIYCTKHTFNYCTVQYCSVEDRPDSECHINRPHIPPGLTIDALVRLCTNRLLRGRYVFEQPDYHNFMHRRMMMIAIECRHYHLILNFPRTIARKVMHECSALRMMYGRWCNLIACWNWLSLLRKYQA